MKSLLGSVWPAPLERQTNSRFNQLRFHLVPQGAVVATDIDMNRTMIAQSTATSRQPVASIHPSLCVRMYGDLVANGTNGEEQANYVGENNCHNRAVAQCNHWKTPNVIRIQNVSTSTKPEASHQPRRCHDSLCN